MRAPGVNPDRRDIGRGLAIDGHLLVEVDERRLVQLGHDGVECFLDHRVRRERNRSDDRDQVVRELELFVIVEEDVALCRDRRVGCGRSPT